MTIYKGTQMRSVEHPEWGTLTIGDSVAGTSHWITWHDGETQLLYDATIAKIFVDTGV